MATITAIVVNVVLGLAFTASGLFMFFSAGSTVQEGSPLQGHGWNAAPFGQVSYQTVVYRQMLGIVLIITGPLMINLTVL
jgi:hypothetical protein